MEQQIKQPNYFEPAWLLPYKFNKIGIFLAAWYLPCVVFVKIIGSNLPPGEKLAGPGKTDWLTFIWTIGLIVGLVFIVWAKEKVEDELAALMRNIALRIAFTGTALVFILLALFNQYRGNPPRPIDPAEPALSLIGIYLISIFIQKRLGK